MVFTQLQSSGSLKYKIKSNYIFDMTYSNICMYHNFNCRMSRYNKKNITTILIRKL